MDEKNCYTCGKGIRDVKTNEPSYCARKYFDFRKDTTKLRTIQEMPCEGEGYEHHVRV